MAKPSIARKGSSRRPLSNLIRGSVRDTVGSFHSLLDDMDGREIDTETADELHAFEKRLRSFLDGAYYEGVNYEDDGPAEGLRLQAERVVKAYNELRADARSADFKSDDLPVGKFAELFTEVKRLDGWLEQVASDEKPADEHEHNGSRDKLADVQQWLQGIEATAKLLSTQVAIGDLDTDLVAVCMSIARDAERGIDALGELIEAEQKPERDDD